MTAAALSMLLLSSSLSAGAGNGLKTSLLPGMSMLAASITELEDRLAKEPDNTEIQYELARSLAFDGKYEQAIGHYRELLERFPDNPDYLLGIGQCYLWQDNTRKAIPYLEQAAMLAPDYQDVTVALQKARASQQQLEAYNKQQARTSQQQDKKYIQLRLENRIEDLNYNSNNWRDTRLTLTRIYDRRTQASVYYQQSDRFDQSDNTYGVQAYYPFSEGITGYMDLGTSPTHRVLPELNVHAQLGFKLPDNWGTRIGFNVRDFTETTVNTVDLSIEKYVTNFSYAYTIYVSDSNAGTALSHRLQAGYFFTDNNSIQLAISTGNELEKAASANNVIETSFSDISLWGKYRVMENLGIHYGLGFTDLDLPGQRSGNRKSLSAGLDYRF